MIKLFFLLIIFSSNQLFSQEKSNIEISGSKSFPLELNLIINSLHVQSNSQDPIIKTFLKIDEYAQSLNKEDIFLIAKIEIYKTLLKSNEQTSRINIDLNSIQALKTLTAKATDPFIKWFLQALVHDTETLLNNPLFKDYLIQQNIGLLKTVELKRIQKKAQLISRWISIINQKVDFQESLQTAMKPLLVEALLNIEQSFFLLASTSFQSFTSPIQSIYDLKFFELKSLKKDPTKKALKKDKTVDDILAPLLDEPVYSPTILLPTPSKEDWLLNEEAPASLKNLPKPNNDASWLEDF